MPTTPRQPAQLQPTVYAPSIQRRCPDCNARVTPQSGCLVCLSCGWSRCG